MIIIQSSLPKGICYVETKNLDGETNLKHKQADKEVMKVSQEIIEGDLKAEIICEPENESIYTYQGTMTIKGRNKMLLGADQLLLRGSSLRNTEWIIGIAVYTGHDSKVMMNQSSSPNKLSKIEKASQYYIVMMIVLQFLVCLVSASYFTIWANSSIDGRSVVEAFTYLELNQISPESKDAIYNMGWVGMLAVAWGRWFLIMQNFLSISLLVSLEMVKFTQGNFMQWDWMMYDLEKDMPMQV